MRRYLVEFGGDVELNSYTITSNSPKEAIKICFEHLGIQINTLEAADEIDANIRVKLLSGTKDSISYYKVDIIKHIKKSMAAGMRKSNAYMLTPSEIETVKRAIKQIDADMSLFRFNNKIRGGTCYMPDEDLIYICGDILPDIGNWSNHPRDVMSIRAVLAHEYYGHRPRRQQYLDEMSGKIKPMPRWLDEYIADYNAAKYGKGLDDFDRYHLIQSAILRKEEANQYVEMDSFMRRVLYGYDDRERRFIQRGKRISI